MSMADENNVFMTGFQTPSYRGFKVINGIRTSIDFQDAYFYASSISALSSSFYVFGGFVTFPYSQSLLKVFTDGTLRTIRLDSGAHNSDVTVVKAIEPGKIVAANKSKIFMFRNEILFTYDLTGENYFYQIAGSNSTVYFVCYTFSSERIEKIYRLQDVTLFPPISESIPSGTSHRKYAIGDKLVKLERVGETSTCSYLNESNTWTVLFTRTGQAFTITGESINNIYLVGAGVIWNGSSFQDDPAGSVPVQRTEPSIGLTVSNAKSNSFYISQRYHTVDSISYIYKRK
jgi:hypothetical protein